MYIRYSPSDKVYHIMSIRCNLLNGVHLVMLAQCDLISFSFSLTMPKPSQCLAISNLPTTPMLPTPTICFILLLSSSVYTHHHIFFHSGLPSYTIISLFDGQVISQPNTQYGCMHQFYFLSQHSPHFPYHLNVFF